MQDHYLHKPAWDNQRKIQLNSEFKLIKTERTMFCQKDPDIAYQLHWKPQLCEIDLYI